MENESRTFRFTEEQWRDVGSLVPIPNEAKPDFEFLVETSRKMSAEVEVHGKPQMTRIRIEKMLSKTTALLRELHSLSPDIIVTMVRGDATAAIDYPKTRPFSIFARSSPIEEEEKLRKIVENVEYLEKWLAAAANRSSRQRGQTGANAEATFFLVREIDKTLGKYGLPRVSRSKKRGASLPFVKAIVEIAHPDVGNGSIVEAVKEAVRLRLDFEARATRV